MSFDIVDIV